MCCWCYVVHMLVFINPCFSLLHLKKDFTNACLQPANLSLHADIFYKNRLFWLFSFEFVICFSNTVYVLYSSKFAAIRMSFILAQVFSIKNTVFQLIFQSDVEKLKRIYFFILFICFPNVEQYKQCHYQEKINITLFIYNDHNVIKI